MSGQNDDKKETKASPNKSYMELGKIPPPDPNLIEITSQSAPRPSGKEKWTPESETQSLPKLLNPLHMPCFRTSMLTGIIVGGGTWCAAVIIKKNIPSALDYFFYGWLGGSVLRWFHCRYEYEHKRTAVREMLTRKPDKAGKIELTNEEKESILRQQRDLMQQQLEAQHAPVPERKE